MRASQGTLSAEARRFCPHRVAGAEGGSRHRHRSRRGVGRDVATARRRGSFLPDGILNPRRANITLRRNLSRSRISARPRTVPTSTSSPRRSRASSMSARKRRLTLFAGRRGPGLPEEPSARPSEEPAVVVALQEGPAAPALSSGALPACADAFQRRPLCQQAFRARDRRGRIVDVPERGAPRGGRSGCRAGSWRAGQTRGRRRSWPSSRSRKTCGGTPKLRVPMSKPPIPSPTPRFSGAISFSRKSDVPRSGAAPREMLYRMAEMQCASGGDLNGTQQKLARARAAVAPPPPVARSAAPACSEAR